MSTLKCPLCKKVSQIDVIDSRPVKTGEFIIKRRRHCARCNGRFSTKEFYLDSKEFRDLKKQINSDVRKKFIKKVREMLIRL